MIFWTPTYPLRPGILKSVKPENEIAILKELSVNYIQLIKESYNYNQENSILRTKEDISLGAIDYLLSDPELIHAIGYNYVATWLNTTEQFLMFEKLVFHEKNCNCFNCIFF